MHIEHNIYIHNTAALSKFSPEAPLVNPKHVVFDQTGFLWRLYLGLHCSLEKHLIKIRL